MKEILEKEVPEKYERSILVPFLVGGVVGAGIAFLMAPKSGKAMRKDLVDFAVRTRDSISKTIDTTVDRSKALYEDGKTAVVGAIEAGKDAFLKERDRHRRAA
ncbi:MAG TPA: YtxH domain-containing protein [Nitrospirota bacterium]|nr:YtxH domain-containing protein [Nitrospirota bacterium]